MTIRTQATQPIHSRRRFLQIAAIATGGALLAACTAPQAPAATDSEGGTAAQAPVELRWWVNPFTEDDIANVWNPLTEKFYAAGNDNIQIETEIMPWSDRRQKMMTSYAGGRAADVACMNVDMVWNFGSAGALAPLNDYISPEIYSDTPQALSDLCVIEGNRYMVPYNTGPFGHLYNPQLMESAGWDPDSPPVTWDELREFGPMAAGAGLYSILLEVAAAEWYTVLWGNGGRILMEDAEGNVIGSALDSDAVRETWQFHKEHYDNSWSPIEFVTMNVTEQMPDYFLQGAMAISSKHSAQGASLAVSQAEGIEIRILSQPLEKIQPATNSSDGSVTMYSTCKDFVAGGEWLNFVMSADILAEWSNLGGYIPSREAARASSAWTPSEVVRTFGDLAPNVLTNKDRYFYFSPGYQTINPEFHSYLLDDKSLDEALMAAHDGLNALIEEDLNA